MTTFYANSMRCGLATRHYLPPMPSAIAATGRTQRGANSKGGGELKGDTHLFISRSATKAGCPLWFGRAAVPRAEDAAETDSRGVVAEDPGLVPGDAARRDRVDRPGGGRGRAGGDGGVRADAGPQPNGSGNLGKGEDASRRVSVGFWRHGLRRPKAEAVPGRPRRPPKVTIYNQTKKIGMNSRDN
jgi:hypothetical protein